MKHYNGNKNYKLSPSNSRGRTLCRSAWRVVTVGGTNLDKIRKQLFRRRGQSTPSRACACLHGLFHGQPGTQPSSPMPPASPTIARARRAPNPLHLLLTVIGRHDLLCGFPVPQSSMAMLLLLQCNRRTLHSVERARIASAC